MSDITFNDIRQSVLAHYDSGSDFWNRVNLGTATEAEIYDAYSKLPVMTLEKSIDGTTLGWDWTASMDKIARVDYADPSAREALNNQINELFSNTQPAYYGEGNSYNMNVPANFGGSSGNYTVDSGATSGASKLAVVADKACLAVTGVNVGCKLGMLIDSAIYSLDPAWWDEHYPTINPQTWDSIASTSGGQSFIRTLFGIPSTGASTAYVDERVLAYTYQMLRDSGAFATGDTTATYTGATSGFPNPSVKQLTTINKLRENNVRSFSVFTVSDSCIAAAVQRVSGVPSSGYMVFIISRSYQSTAYTEEIYDYNDPYTPTATYTYGANTRNTTFNGTTFYYTTTIFYPNNGQILVGTVNDVYIGNGGIDDARQIATILLDGTIHTENPIPGISQATGATVPSPTIITGTTTDQVLQQLKTSYPQLFDGSITSSVLQDDGSITDFNYVPIPWSTGTGLNDSQPTTGTATQGNTDMDDATITDILTGDPTDTPPDTGTGNTPPVVVPTGYASSLWAIYHPSQAELDAFGAWLWSSDFVEQIKRLFVDPMQAIIGVHKVFAPIPTGGTQTIKCGYLDSGVSSPTVSNQYTTVNCGSAYCTEYFGNVFDYEPYTKVSIYLPFIGVVPLKTSEVMRSKVTVTYGVDVITGACLAKVSIDRDGAGGILYTYGGSCACHYPVSSGSYSGIISGVVSSAVGIATGIATGSPLAAVGGVLAGVKQAHVDVQHSGGFTGCSGAMGPKKPYLIITRPQIRVANGVKNFDGLPSNASQIIGDCTGFVKVSSAHVKSSHATDPELAEIVDYLKSGIII